MSAALHGNWLFDGRNDADAVLSDELHNEGWLAGHEPGLDFLDAVVDQSNAVVHAHVLIYATMYLFVEGIHRAVHEVLGIAMRRLIGFDERAQIVDPVELGDVSVEAPKDRVDLVGSFAQGFRQLAPDEVSGFLGAELDAVLELHELEVLLDVVAKGEDVAVLTADAEQHIVAEVPDLVVVSLASATAYLHFHDRVGVDGIGGHDDEILALKGDGRVHAFKIFLNSGSYHPANC